jgi:hypothetical protein
MSGQEHTEPEAAAPRRGYRAPPIGLLNMLAAGGNRAMIRLVGTGQDGVPETASTDQESGGVQ